MLCSGLQFFKQFGCRDRLLKVGGGGGGAGSGDEGGGGGGAMSLLKSCGQTPDTRASSRTGVVHGRRAPRQEWSMEESTKTGVVHGPWEESTKTGMVHGRRAPRQEWSMGGEHQDSRTEGRRAEGPLHGFYCWFHSHILDHWLGYGFKRGNGLFREKILYKCDHKKKKLYLHQK